MSAVKEFPKKMKKRDKQVMLQRHYKVRKMYLWSVAVIHPLS